MKLNSKVLVLTFLLTKITYACPEVSGVWSCVDTLDSKNRVEYNITQEQVDVGTKYTLNEKRGSTVFLADGILHSYNEGDVSGTQITQCKTQNTVESIETGILMPHNLQTKVISKIEKSNNKKIRISYVAQVGIPGTSLNNESKTLYSCNRIN